MVSTIGKITLVNSSGVRITGNDLANPPFGSSILLVGCSNVEVGNNTINNSSSEVSGDAGVKAIACRNLTVHDITIQRVYAGVFLVDTNGTVLQNVTSLRCEYGLRIEGGRENRINYSGFSDNNIAGIVLSDTSRNRINLTIMNGNGKYGFFIEGDYDNEIGQDCTVENEKVYYLNRLAGVGGHVRITGLTLTKPRVSNVGKVTLVNSRNVTISGCVLRNNEFGSGLFVLGSHDIRLFDNEMSGNHRGISLVDTNASTLSNNSMDSIRYGLYVEGRFDNWIHLNNTANAEAIHYYYGNASVNVSGLNLTRKRVSNVGKVTFVEVGRASVTGCLLANGTAGVMTVNSTVNVTSSTLRSNRWGMWGIGGRLDVRDTDVVGNDVGLSAGEILVDDCRITGNGIGVQCLNRSIVGNSTINGNDLGILVEGGGNLLLANRVANSTGASIDLRGDGNRIMNNTCLRNEFGIVVRGGENNVVSGNVIRRNGNFGLRMKGDPHNLTIEDNTFVGNGFSNPFMGSGIFISGAANLTIGRNRLYWHEYSDVLIQYTRNITLEGCQMNGTPTGIKTYYAQEVHVLNCSIDADGWGVESYESEDMEVLNSSITSGGDFAVWFQFSRRTVIEGNDLAANISGVRFTAVRDGRVGNNTISASVGIDLVVCRRNSVWWNDIDAGVGVRVRTGSEDNVLGHMDLDNMTTAILIEDSNGTVVRNSTFSDNAVDIRIDEAVGGLIGGSAFHRSDVAVSAYRSTDFEVGDCRFQDVGVAVEVIECDRIAVRSGTAGEVGEFLRAEQGYKNAVYDTDLSGVSVAVNLTYAAEAIFINVTFEDDQIVINDMSILYIMNYLRVRLLYFDLTPLKDGGVKVTEDDTVRYRSTLFGGLDPDTDARGETPWFTVAYATYRNDSKDFPPVNVSARFLFWNDSRAVNMSTTHTEVFITNITPPRLNWTGEDDYGDDGVGPDIGNATQYFEFRVLYTDPNGDPPLEGEPLVWIDVDGDGQFNGSFGFANGTFEEGGFTMTRAGSSTNHAEGVVYRFITRLPVSDRIQYRFSTRDSRGLPATEGDPLTFHPGPLVLSGNLTVSSVTIDGLTVNLHSRLLLSNGTYVNGFGRGDVAVWDGGERNVSVSVPSNRTISLLIDWSTSGSAEIRSSVGTWMAPFVGNLTDSDFVEVLKYEAGAHRLCALTNDTATIYEAINTSVPSGTEAFLYDAINASLRDGRHHIL
ncbi:MAG TPA: hypothetical protein EYP43_01620, partial [Thermoplasmata archaeon]|nr:hypothetical protein [Thermoplasmata archaeon]